MASGDGSGSKPGRLHRHRVLVQPGARRVAHKTRRLHQNMAAPLVCSQTRQALLVQGPRRRCRTLLRPTRRHLRRYIPHCKGRRGRPPQAVFIRALHPALHHVLRRRL